MARPKKTEDTIDVVEEVTQNDVTEEKKSDTKDETVKKIYLITDTPYLAVPNINNNVTGILKAGSVYRVVSEFNNGEDGEFWEIDGKRYINKAWNVEVF